MIATDRRSASAVGRHARLELVFARRNGRTMLVHAYAEPPFRVGHTFAAGTGLHLMLATSAPGIFAGDHFEQVIRLEQGAEVRLTSQSALQVHPSFGPRRDDDPPAAGANQTARLCTTYHVDADAVLECEWHPMIPFAGARLDQRIAVELSPSATLYWSDAFMAGRHAFAGRMLTGSGDAIGERWAFASLAHELRVTRDATLEYLERYRLDPRNRSVHHPWITADACYFGTMLVSGGSRLPLVAEHVERVHTELSACAGLTAAVDRVDTELVIGRLMAEGGVPFHSARRCLARAFAPITRNEVSQSV